MKLTLNWSKLLTRAIGIVLLIDLGLVVWAGKATTVSTMDYLMVVLDTVTSWTGRIVWTLAALWAFVLVFFRGKPPKVVSPSEISQVFLNRIPALIHRLVISVPLLLVLISFVPLIIWQAREASVYLSPASGVIIAPEGEEIYVVDEKRSKIYVYVLEELFSDLPRSLEPARTLTIHGKPQRVAIAPSKKKIYVTDTAGHKIIVFDKETNYREEAVITVGKVPRWIAITPDERKAYVSNEQPFPQGSISVIDLTEGPTKNKVIKTITGVNCPEGLAVVPDGTRLYVASQCGAGQDPVFVIDTATDKVVATIPGLAVGLTLAVTPDGKKVYVARGNFRSPDPSTGMIEATPHQVSVISTENNTIEKTIKFPLGVISLAITRDSEYVLVGSGKRIDILRTETDEVVNTIPLATSPGAIAISEDKRAFVWLPEEDRLFVLGLSGLLGPQGRSE